MNSIYLMFFLFLLLMFGVVSIMRDFVAVKTAESFENTSMSTTYNIPDGSMEYISCIALDPSPPPPPPNDESSERIDTIELVSKAPFWSKFIDFNIRSDLMYTIMQTLIELCRNRNTKTLKGPIYVLMGRNKTTKTGNAWIYMPSILKNGEIVTDNTIYAYNHQWLRSLLFSNALGISHYYCNNPCDEDIIYSADDLALLALAGDNVSFKPECGCIAEKDKACPFMPIPLNVDISPRNKDIISTYAVYRIHPEFFTNVDITLTTPYSLEINRFMNGQIMYEGCDTRLLSNNRLHSFEITPSGFALYDTTSDKPFDENCIPKPNTISNNDNKIIRENTNHDITGIYPRMINEDENISVFSIIQNSSTKKNEWVKQWAIDTVGKQYPYQIYLDDDGILKIKDNRGTISDVKFIQ